MLAVLYLEERGGHGLAVDDHPAAEKPVAAVLAVGLRHVIHLDRRWVALERVGEERRVVVQILARASRAEGEGGCYSGFIAFSTYFSIRSPCFPMGFRCVVRYNRGRIVNSNEDPRPLRSTI